jgi:hypothetical protein
MTATPDPLAIIEAAYRIGGSTCLWSRVQERRLWLQWFLPATAGSNKQSCLRPSDRVRPYGRTSSLLLHRFPLTALGVISQGDHRPSAITGDGSTYTPEISKSIPA